MTISITPVSGALGAVIEGTDPRDDDFDFDAVHRALLEHEVIFFPALGLTEEEQLRFGRRFGTPSVYPVARILGATEPTMTVIADGPDSPNAADAWHTDVSWTATPPAYALLHMEVVPEVGGDTLWASATKAYDTLSPAMQGFLCGLTVVHDHDGFAKRVAAKAGDASAAIIEGLDRDYPPVEHPLIRTHPETGKRAILFARQFISHIKDLTEAESRMVLDFIETHVKEVALHCRWSWSQGDLAIWDERSTLHRSAADHWPQRRVIRRLEIDGDRPFFDPS
ncbi:MAG: TauD/TfdA family dioxygenase [Acidimicrobiia bacterium]|nr:TauD/TfdA family dioxygenase [Acidimicrobiia bacterium]MDH5236309.1 TauD/TfdA family dioxygenase [Acidimicrobiia bacterium]